ncbi:chemotaxis protein CheW [Tranquillimonas alkanivorans]|uniref:CheW protein n=1 Tax=Tranquillimonas alkanivorans TaxID=441119 RepID=A0A1I5M4F8_9RHOB|nr:chemotaxis protein CheW [Tranquillimonas alkanivorans]SFP04409.1 CheW protein [Tranquillimonas alkanivorans]
MTAPHRASEGSRDVVTLRLGDEVLAVPARSLREVLEPMQITRVPRTDDFVRGLINVRGAVVPLADLRVPFDMPRKPADADTRILVLELPLAGTLSVVGVIADAVHEVTQFDLSSLEDVPAVGTRWPPHLVTAIGRWNGRFVILPDLEAIFDSYLGGADTSPPSELEHSSCD